MDSPPLIGHKHPVFRGQDKSSQLHLFHDNNQTFLYKYLFVTNLNGCYNRK